MMRRYFVNNRYLALSLQATTFALEYCNIIPMKPNLRSNLKIDELPILGFLLQKVSSLWPCFLAFLQNGQ